MAPDYPLLIDSPSPFPSIIGLAVRRYIRGTQDLRRDRFAV
jgi:hypothetical protein